MCCLGKEHVKHVFNTTYGLKKIKRKVCCALTFQVKGLHLTFRIATILTLGVKEAAFQIEYAALYEFISQTRF